MDGHKRPLGITALAFASVMVGLYCQIAAMALLFGGTVLAVTRSDLSVVVVALGVLYLGLMAAAYFVGYGFWSQRHWSWAGGIVVFSVLIVFSVLLVFISGNVLSAVGPSAGAAVAVWYLYRPATRRQLLGTARTAEPDQVELPAGLGAGETPQPVR